MLGTRDRREGHRQYSGKESISLIFGDDGMDCGEIWSDSTGGVL